MLTKNHLSAIQTLRAAIRLYTPCQGCGNEACEAMHAALAESDGLVEDIEILVVEVPEMGPEELVS